MTRAIPMSIVAPFLKEHEGCVLRVYDDKQPKKVLGPHTAILGVLTAGYGHTGGLSVGQKVTQADADRWLEEDLRTKASAPLAARIGDIIPDLTDHQYAALLSFVFNLGTGPKGAKEWTIWKRLRARAFDQVPLDVMKFVNWSGQKSAGLVRRRSAEVVLWSTAEPGSTKSDPPSSVTRREATPATPTDPKAVSTPMLTAAGTAVATIAAGAGQVTQAIQPFAAQSEGVGKLIATLAMIAAALAVLGLVVTWMKHRSLRT